MEDPFLAVVADMLQGMTRFPGGGGVDLPPGVPSIAARVQDRAAMDGDAGPSPLTGGGHGWGRSGEEGEEKGLRDG